MIARPRLPMIGTATKAMIGMLALLITAAVAYLATSGNSAASNAKPDLTIQVGPASQTVTRGQSATYTVSITPTNGFTGSVVLTTSKLPSGATGTFNPASVNIGTSTVSSTLT